MGDGRPAIVPAIRGSAWITGISQLLVDPSRPVPRGLRAVGHLGRERATTAWPAMVDSPALGDDEPLPDRGHLAALRAACPHDPLRRRAPARGARRPLRAGRVERARRHRPLDDHRAAGARRHGAPARHRAHLPHADGRLGGRARLRPRARARRRPRRRAHLPRPARCDGVRGRARRRRLRRPPLLERRADGRGRRACRPSSGIEVYNAGCEIENGRGLSTVHWDMLLDSGRSCFAVACDDTHYAGFDSGYAWTMARVSEPTPAALLEALRTGAGYGSTGPRFDAIEPVAGGHARALQPVPVGDAPDRARGRLPAPTSAGWPTGTARRSSIAIRPA